MNNKTNIVSNDQFIELLNKVVDLGKVDAVITQSHPELLEILQTILYTPCDVNIDYADLLGFANHSNFISYGVIRHKGPQASVYASMSALESVLEEGEIASGFVTHVSVPLHYSFDKLCELGDVINKRFLNEGDSAFEFDISSKFTPDEITIYILCGHTKKENP